MGFTKPIMFRTSTPGDQGNPVATTEATPTEDVTTKATQGQQAQKSKSIGATPDSERRGVSNKTVTFSLDNPDAKEMAGNPAIPLPSAFSQS